MPEGSRPGFRSVAGRDAGGASAPSREEEGGGEAAPAGGRLAAALFSAATAFLAGVAFARWVHPALLVDPDPHWRFPRALVWLALAGVVSGAGWVAYRAFHSFSRSEAAGRPEAPLPFGSGSLLFLGSASFAMGSLLRLAGLESIPFPLWVDDLSLVPAALSLSGAPGDFADAIRASPFGGPKPYGSVGVLYLELYRLCLLALETTVLGVRLPSALGGIASLATAALLGRALLPSGGGVTTLLVLAGLRWHLILSRWAWNAIVLAAVTDLAAYLVVRSRAARDRRAGLLALLAGVVAGAGAHVYLAAFVAAAALLLYAAWPGEGEPGRRPGTARGALFLVGFCAAVAPLFLLREGRTFSYFARAERNLVSELRWNRSVWPLFDVAADALAAPWLVPDPAGRNDVPGRSRLGVVVGAAAALALARALARPRREISAFLLSHVAAAFAAAVAGGGALLPNGYRFVYLAGPASVAAAAGILALLQAAPPDRRRVAALLLLGGVAVSGAAGSRDALVRWPNLPSTWGAPLGLGFFGADTLLGRAVVRWARYGTVSVEPGLAHSDLHWKNLARYRIVTRREREAWFGPHGPAGSPEGRQFRIVVPSTVPRPGERQVERIVEPWGRAVASVLSVPGDAGGSRGP